GHVIVSAHHVAGLNRVDLSGTDTGIGIAPQDLPLIFEKFLQLDASRTRSQGGVCLGVHIVKTFSEGLGGTVEGTSQVGEGTTFTITLPRVYEGVGAIRTHARKRPETTPES